MERFCDKCGTLVSGDGEFCPSCGARLEGAVSVPGSGIDLGKPGVEPMMPNSPLGSVPTPNPTPTPNTYQGQSSGYSQQPVYPQPNYSQPAQKEMTVGEWALTIFLSGLNIIGIILLFVWAFSNDTPTTKKNWARAMLILAAIGLGLSLLILIGSCMCGLALGDSIFDGGYYASLFMR